MATHRVSLDFDKTCIRVRPEIVVRVGDRGEQMLVATLYDHGEPYTPKGTLKFLVLTSSGALVRSMPMTQVSAPNVWTCAIPGQAYVEHGEARRAYVYDYIGGDDGSGGDSTNDVKLMILPGTTDEEAVRYFDAEIERDRKAFGENEEGRKEAETAREEAERKRDEAEQARAGAEGERASAETGRDTAERARAQAEEERASSEAARKSAEETRQSQEGARQSAEDERIEAETARDTAERARAEAEDARDAAETARDGAEQARASAEQARETAENSRDTAEQVRANAEKARAAAEGARDEAETVRQSQESTRQTQEAAREAAEALRKSSETARGAAEDAREGAEGKRVEAESARKAAEGVRETNESTRETDEAARKRAETERATEEGKRATAESERAAAETKRAADFTASQDANAKAFEAAQTERQETFDANEAARAEAEDAREDAESKRDAAEKLRASAEAARKQAEADRADAETARDEAEQARASAEAARAAAQSDRDARQTANDAAQAKNDAAQQANNKAALGLTVRILKEGEYDPATRVPTVEGDFTNVFCVPTAEAEAAMAEVREAEKALKLAADSVGEAPSFDGGVSQVIQSAQERLASAYAVQATNHYMEWLWLLDEDGNGYWEPFGTSEAVLPEGVTTDEIDRMFEGETVSNQHIGDSAGLSYLVGKTTGAISAQATAQAATDTAQDESIQAAQSAAEAAQRAADSAKSTAASELADAVATQAERDTDQDTAIAAAKKAGDDASAALTAYKTAQKATDGAQDAAIAEAKKAGTDAQAAIQPAITAEDAAVRKWVADTAKAKSAGSADVAAKLGGETVGSATIPIYLKSGVATAANAIPTIPGVATKSANGLMSKEDKALLDSISSGETGMAVSKVVLNDGTVQDVETFIDDKLAGLNQNVNLEYEITRSFRKWCHVGEALSIDTVIDTTSTAKARCTFTVENPDEKLVPGEGYEVDGDRAIFSADAGVTHVTIKSTYTHESHGADRLHATFTGADHIERREDGVVVIEDGWESLDSIEDLPWADLKLIGDAAACDRDSFLAYVGKERTFTWGTYTVTARIVDIAKEKTPDGKDVGFIFHGYKGFDTHNMNSSDTTAGGYASSAMKTWLEGLALPEELDPLFQEYVLRYRDTTSGPAKSINVKVGLMAASNLYWAGCQGENSMSKYFYSDEGEPYQYFKDHDTLDARKHYNTSGGADIAWLLSPNSTTAFMGAYSDGLANYYNASNAYVPSARFCLGSSV